MLRNKIVLKKGNESKIEVLVEFMDSRVSDARENDIKYFLKECSFTTLNWLFQNSMEVFLKAFNEKMIVKIEK